MNILEIADIVGVIAFALSGFMVATKDRLDLLGIVIASFLTALGGGIIRDVIADRTPYVFTTMVPSLMVLGVIGISLILKLYKRDKVTGNHYFIISDSIGLVSFSITGALVGSIAGFNTFGVVFMAFTTAVGGGLLRDTLLNRIPIILVSELYGTIAVLIGITMTFLNNYDLINERSISIIFVLALFLRLLAYYKKWHLPILQ